MKHATMRAIALALILTLLMTTATFAAVPTDVKGTSYETAISFLMDKNAIIGYPDGTFLPNHDITRAEVCAIVVRAMNPEPIALSTRNSSMPAASFKDFADIPDWALPYVNYALSKGIINGYPDGTFQARGNISYIETIAMTLRAAGYTDSVVGGTWPTNYQQKAASLNLMTNLPAPVTNTNAERWMVAQFVYNSYSQIQTAAGTVNTFVPGTTPIIRGTGQFNADMTEYDGKPIAKDVKVYTWGKSSQYTAGMTLPAIASAYTEDTTFKFKSASTPACYAMKDGKIIGMILPMDTGFSGRVYAVINGISQRLNADGDSVYAIETMVAGKPVTWLAKTSLPAGDIKPATTSPGATGYLDGQVYELITTNGQVKEINTDEDGDKHAYFAEITDGITAAGDYKIHEFSDPVLTLKDASGNKFEVAAVTSIYVRSFDGEEYTAGSRSDLRAGSYVRAYDITEEGSIASILVVDKDHAFPTQ